MRKRAVLGQENQGTNCVGHQGARRFVNRKNPQENYACGVSVIIRQKEFGRCKEEKHSEKVLTGIKNKKNTPVIKNYNISSGTRVFKPKGIRIIAN